jgi:hypothetical protein
MKWSITKLIQTLKLNLLTDIFLACQKEKDFVYDTPRSSRPIGNVRILLFKTKFQVLSDLLPLIMPIR